MEAKHIQLLNKAKKRLKSAIKRFRQAEGFLDEFKAAVPPEEKDAWANVPAEYHLLFDGRRNIRGARHEVLPSIRKTGGYALEPLTSEGGIAALLEHNATAIKLLRPFRCCSRCKPDRPDSGQGVFQNGRRAGYSLDGTNHHEGLHSLSVQILRVREK